MSLFLASLRNQKRTKKKAITSGGFTISGISYPISIKKMHEEQEETEQSRKDYGRECPLGIEKFAKQQHSESIVEQTDIGSPSEQHRKCLDEWQ